MSPHAPTSQSRIAFPVFGTGTIILPAISAAVSLIAVLWASPLVFFSILALALVALALAWPRRDRVTSQYPTPKRPAVLLAGAHNFRDLGGIPTADGKHRVRAGTICRSDAMSRLTPGDVAHLDQHVRPRLIVDLRDCGERRAAPNRVSQSAPPRILELPVGRGMESTLSHKALKAHLMAGTIAATDAEMAQAMIDLTHRLPEHAAERWAQMFDAVRVAAFGV